MGLKTQLCSPPPSPLTTTSTMSFQRLGLRMAQQSFRTQQPAFRQQLQFIRRVSTRDVPGGKLTGTADNAFNRERAAVKAHAAATTDLWRKLSIYIVIPCLVLASINA